MKEIIQVPIKNRSQITLMPTGACNMNCPYCTQKAVRENYGNYFMTLAEFEYFLDRMKKMDIHYREFLISGGEPTLWPELENACALVRERKTFKMIRLYTNCIKKDMVASLLERGLIDEIYTSYSNGHRDNQIELKERFGEKIRLSRTKERHKKPPMIPYPDVTPVADCVCARPTIIGGRVYICGSIYSIITRLGKNINDYPRISASLEENWEKKFKKVNKFNMIFCAYCTANPKVWKQIPEPED